MEKKIEILNKKAGFNFHIEQKYEAGIILTGSEVKSVRNRNVNMGDSYCFFEDKELWLKNLHISEWKTAHGQTHDPMRDRKLLLNKQELKKIDQKIKSKGFAMFPIRLFENDRGLFKLELGLGTGKKEFDKRDDIKQREAKRELSKILKA